MTKPVVGIYVIRNTVNGKVYVGSSMDVEYRWRLHLSMLRGNRHHSRHLQAAFLKYGESAFAVTQIVSVIDPAHLLEFEQHFMDEMRAADQRFGYNMRPRAGSNRGRKCRPETLEKMRAANLGKKQSLETIRKRTGHQAGRQLPKSWCDAIANGKLGKERPDIREWAPLKFCKLDDAQVKVVRALRAEGQSFRKIADQFGHVSVTPVRNAIYGLGLFYSRVA